MLARVQSYLLSGIDALACEVEIDFDRADSDKPSLIVGLPDAAVKESVERVRSALFNSGYLMPKGRTLINLAPANLRKEGPLYDLPIALGILINTGVVPPPGAAPKRAPSWVGKATPARNGQNASAPSASSNSPTTTKAHTPTGPSLPSDTDDDVPSFEPEVFEPLDIRQYLIAGELALDGRVRPIKGVIAMAALAKQLNLRGVIVPRDNAPEAAVVPGVDAIGVSSIVELLGLVTGQVEALPHAPVDVLALLRTGSAEIDFADVRGQEAVKRAIIIACAGGHNLLTLCPSAGPGCSPRNSAFSALPHHRESPMRTSPARCSRSGHQRRVQTLRCGPAAARSAFASP